MLVPADYHTSESFRRDLELIAANWVPVCRSDEVAEPGAQKRAPVATTEVLVTRSENGALHAVSNVCRHRALILVEDTARAPLIRCPYHLWNYGLDGKLRVAPFMDGADLKDCDLPRYAVEEWGGWVFVNLDGKATPLSDLLAPLESKLRPGDLATWKIGFRIPFDHTWNWKVMLENFGESYHHIGAHAGTLQPLWPGGESDSRRSTGHWIELAHSNHPQAGTFVVYVIYPLFLLALSDPGFATWYRMVPLGPARIGLEIIGLFPPEQLADTAHVETLKAQLTAIHLEDIPMCERTQAGLQAANATLGPLSPLETGVASFRNWVSKGA